MELVELKKLLKEKLQPSKNKNVKISHPWELFKMAHLKLLEVRYGDIVFLIEKVNGEWKVSIIERGSVFEEKIFPDESTACHYFKDMLIPLAKSPTKTC